MAATAAASPRTLTHSSTGRFGVTKVLARSWGPVASSRSDCVEGLVCLAEVAGFCATFEETIGGPPKLVGDEHRQEVDGGHVFALRLQQATLEDGSHAAQAQLPERVVKLNEVHRDSPW